MPGKRLALAEDSLCFGKRQPVFRKKTACVLGKDSLCFEKRQPVFLEKTACVSEKDSLCFLLRQAMPGQGQQHGRIIAYRLAEKVVA